MLKNARNVPRGNIPGRAAARPATVSLARQEKRLRQAVARRSVLIAPQVIIGFGWMLYAIHAKRASTPQGVKRDSTRLWRQARMKLARHARCALMGNVRILPLPFV